MSILIDVPVIFFRYTSSPRELQTVMVWASGRGLKPSVADVARSGIVTVIDSVAGLG